ncbi:bifunctional glycosyltransferase family 2/GtrA family protein [Microbacterium capsulatum]|uniref:dolichyl-phosphate beta-glucosyltransferase n=1 Tax=Microbacterium capsulatum TaxID=3041921 RepID=A0ABU0XLW0_9MICO|nr:bifunctional glycosyltransferase family 2/GtrA family protein [Microbacterium sp. ASV81]MDQ4215599.1 bifunctional glycosyltransferase family 2/GtrA family protein [Microbacterium sp. ASV81]
MTDQPPLDLDLDVVVPVHNEQDTLEQSIALLHEHLGGDGFASWRITIADNASTDDTARIADELAARFEGVVAVHLPEKGRGRALRAVWSASPARVLVYVDEDLSTDLRALRPLVAPLLSGHSDLAIGSRLSRASRIVRGGKREFVSRSYNLLLRGAFGVRFSDAQCGFKAIRAEAAHRLLPYVEDDAWFFDTELLLLAERSGLRIHEVPVDWIDDPHSSVDIVPTAIADLRGMVRVGADLVRGRIPVDDIYREIGRHPYAQPTVPLFAQLVRFGVIGVLSTVAYALAYLLFQLAMPAQAANFLALLVTAIANTAANRRFTFGIRGRSGAAAHHLQGLVVFGMAWLLTSGSLVLLHATDPHPGAFVEVGVLTVANLVATLLRFVLLRVWVFRDRAPADHPEPLSTRHHLTTLAQEANRS